MSTRWLAFMRGGALFVCSGLVYLHHTYFFNPLTFRRSPVLYLPFSWYQRPLQVDVVDIRPTAHTIRYRTFSPRAVRFVIGQLTKATVVRPPRYPATETSFIHIWIRSGAKWNSPILQDAYIQAPAHPNVAQIATRHRSEFVALPSALQRWMDQALKHGQSVR